jgi:hypothetical protein
MKKSKITLESLVESYKLSGDDSLLLDNAVTIVDVNCSGDDILLNFEDYESTWIKHVDKIDMETDIQVVIRFLRKEYNVTEYEVFRTKEDKLKLVFVRYKIDSDNWKTELEIIKFYQTGDVKSFDFDGKKVFRLYIDEMEDEDSKYIMDAIDIETDEPIMGFSYLEDKETIDSEEGLDYHLGFIKEIVREETGLVWHRIFDYEGYIHVMFLDNLNVVNLSDECIEITDGEERVIIPKQNIFWLINQIMIMSGYERDD